MATDRRTKPGRLPQNFFSLEEVAERWSISERTVRREIKRGNLIAKLMAGKYRISREEILRYEAATEAVALARIGKL